MPVVAVTADDKDLGQIFVVFWGHGISWDFFSAGIALSADGCGFEISSGSIGANWGRWFA